MKNKTCNHKNCKNPVWSGGFCKNHVQKKSPLKSQRKLMFYSDKKGTNRMAQTMQRMLFFQKIWNKRPHVSEISGEKLFGTMSSAWFHHILPKEKFPQADLDEENIIILTMDEHGNVENNMFRYEEINRRRALLLKKYNLI